MNEPDDARGRQARDHERRPRRFWEALRPLEPGRDLALERPLDGADGAVAPPTVYLLDEQGQWAIIIPAGAIVHVHSDADDESVLFECEEVSGTAALAQARCTECGATIPVFELEGLIDRHPHLMRHR